MKKVTTAMLLGAMTATTTAHAVEVEGTAGAVSNYVWRGATQTMGNSAVQGSFSVTSDSGLYGSVWGSQVDYDDDTTGEFDLSFGFKKDINETVSLDMGYIKYAFSGDELKIDDEPSEVYVGLNVGPVSGMIYSDLDTQDKYYATSVAFSDIVNMPFNASAFAGRTESGILDTGVSVSKDFDKFSISYTYTWSEEDYEDSAHSVGLFYNF